MKQKQLPASNGEATAEDNSSPIPPRRETRNLKHSFSQDEIVVISTNLAGRMKVIQNLEEEKKAVAADYKAKIDEQKEESRRLVTAINEGWEMRDVEVDLLYHYPSSGIKTVIRTDTGESHTEVMEVWECNLFNQPVTEDIEPEEIS